MKRKTIAEPVYTARHDPYSQPKTKGAPLLFILPVLIVVLTVSSFAFLFSFNNGNLFALVPLDTTSTIGSETIGSSQETWQVFMVESSLENQQTQPISMDYWILQLERNTVIDSYETTVVTSESMPDPSPAPTQTAAPTETAAPTVAVSPTPTPYPRVLDAAGVPQEGMPVSDFTADSTVHYVKTRANIRELPNTEAAVLTHLNQGDQVKRLGFGLDWSKVEYQSGKTGFVLTSLITTKVILKPTPTPIPSPTPKPAPTATPVPKPTLIPAPTAAPLPVGSTLTDEQKQAMIDLAKSLVGSRYVYAAMSPTVGFDCSGFTSYVYKTLFAIKLPRTAKDQANAGVLVASEAIEVGDIICFDWFNGDGICDHVGLYIGGGKYIHASTSDRTYYSDSGAVKESVLDFSRNPIVSIRRIIH